MKPLLLLVLGLAAAGLAAFFLLGQDGPAPQPGGATEMITRNGPSPNAAGPEEDATLANLEDAGEDGGGRSAAPVDVVAAGAAATVSALADSNIDASTAQRVRVEVLIPSGAPNDAQLRLIGWSDPEIDREDFDWTRDDVRRRFSRRASGAAALQSLAERENDNEVQYSIHAVTPTAAVVDVLFDADATEGQLQLAGEYLYLSEPVQVDLASGETAVTIEPKIGAWISGRVVTGGIKPQVLEDGSYGSARIQGGTMGRGRGRGMNFVDQSVPLDEDLAFNFFGVNPTISIRVSADVPQLAPATTEALELVAGRKVTCEVVLGAGARVRGRVVDLAGDPVQGATVAAAANGAMWQRGGGPTRDAATSKDGRFELQGLGDGSYRISSKLEDWRDGRSEEAVEIEGGVPSLGEVLIVMDEGRVISGVVKLPSGAPAPGASVRLSQPESQDGGAPRRGMGWGRQRDTTERQDTVTDARGRFRFTALAGTAARVAASFESPEGDGAAVALEDVEPGTPEKPREIELKLAPTVVIAGVVVDDAGAPIKDFEVRAAREGFSSRAGTGDGVREAFQNREDGSFAANGASAGTWKVSIRAEGYQSPDDQTLTVVLPQEGDPAVFTLQRLGRVVGTVVDPSGVPVPGAEVKRESAGGFGGFRRERGVTADEAGMFELTDLTAGVQKLVATSDGWAASLPTDVEVLPGAPTEGLLLTLRRGGTIRGIVRDDAGNPWAGRRVTYATGGGPIAMFAGESNTDTDDRGEFVFANVPPGKWSVTASPGEDEMMETMRSAGDESGFFKAMAMNLTVEVVVVNEEEAYVELGAEPREPVFAVGVVTRGGSAVSGGNVTYTREGGDLFANLKRGPIGTDGSYRIELDRPGAYIVSVERDDRRNQFLLDVEGGEEFRADLKLPEGGIAGRVRDAGGSGAAGVLVAAEPSASLSLARFNPRTATTDENGSYEIEDLDPGTYTVRIGATSFSRGRFSGGGAGDTYGRALITGVAVSATAMTTGIDARLKGAGRIVGQIEDAEGSPVAGATVFVRDESGRPIDSISTVRTDSSGRFTYSRISPGTYVVSARTGEAAAEDQAGIVVKEGEDATVKLVTAAATTLIVTTVDGEGEVVRAVLSIRDSEGREVTGLVGTDVFRSFGTGVSTSEQKVGPLPPGRYTVEATDREGKKAKKRVTVRNRAESRVRVKFD